MEEFRVMTNEMLSTLNLKAKNVRKLILQMARQASRANKGAHLGGALSMVDLLTYLFFSEKYEFKSGNGDRFILSKGHACLALYACLYYLDRIPKELIDKYPEPGSPLQGHPLKARDLGIEFSTGSLGMGAALAAGVAYSKKIRNQSGSVFVMLGDGELGEGAIWEAVIFSRAKQLSNLIFVVDNNGYQQTGAISEISGIESINNAFAGFGLHVEQLDGHNIEKIDQMLNPNYCENSPRVLVLETIKGAGFLKMEGNNSFHHTLVSERQFDEFILDGN